MIILNNKKQVVYPISIENILERYVKRIIAKKAYKGYVYYNTLEDKEAKYYDFDKFLELELWKMKFYFQIYLERVLKIKHLGFSPKNKVLLYYYFKTL